MKIDVPKNKFNSFTYSERKALYDLKNDKNVVIKGADKCLVVLVRDRKDYMKEVAIQVGDDEIFEGIPNDLAPLLKTINGIIAQIRKRGDLKRKYLR